MRLRLAIIPVALALLAACADAPRQPDGSAAPRRPAPGDEAAAAAAAHHRQLAQRAAQAGDPATAAREWHIVALLVPGDDAARNGQDAARTAIRNGVRDNLAAGNAALRAGDAEHASAAMLKVLALDPENAEAMKVLREIDRQKLARIQSGRAARAAAAPPARAGAAPAADVSESYDIDQRIEMFKAGDVAGGLQEFRVFVDANPNNQAARQRIGSTVYDRGRELEAKGQREPALGLYEQAVALRGGKPLPEWTARIAATRKALADDYYDKGMQAYRTDVGAAIKLWETSLRYDPQHPRSTAKLAEARKMQEKLGRIPQDTKPR